MKPFMMANGEVLAFAPGTFPVASPPQSPPEASPRSRPQPADTLDTLRRTIARIERRAAVMDESGVNTGEKAATEVIDQDDLDRLFAIAPESTGGVIHLRSGETRAAGALTAFAAGLLARRLAETPGLVLWVSDAATVAEAGRPSPHGLHGLGLDPARLLFVFASKAEDVLWALEEGLATAGIAALLGEVHRLPRALTLTATRRLGLRARERRVSLFLLTHAAEPEALAVDMRVEIRPAPSRRPRFDENGLGPPAQRLAFEKLRGHPRAPLVAEWTHDRHTFSLAPALSGDLAALSDVRAAGAGTVLRLPPVRR